MSMTSLHKTFSGLVSWISRMVLWLRVKGWDLYLNFRWVTEANGDMELDIFKIDKCKRSRVSFTIYEMFINSVCRRWSTATIRSSIRCHVMISWYLPTSRLVAGGEERVEVEWDGVREGEGAGRYAVGGWGGNGAEVQGRKWGEVGMGVRCVMAMERATGGDREGNGSGGVDVEAGRSEAMAFN